MDDSTYSFLASLNFPQHLLNIGGDDDRRGMAVDEEQDGMAEGSPGSGTLSGMADGNEDGSLRSAQDGQADQLVGEEPLVALLQSAIAGAGVKPKKRKYSRRFSIGRRKKNPVWEYYYDLRQ